MKKNLITIAEITNPHSGFEGTSAVYLNGHLQADDFAYSPGFAILMVRLGYDVDYVELNATEFPWILKDVVRHLVLEQLL